MMFKYISTAVCLVLMLISIESHAHGGGLDSYGCHRNNSKGNYHCHQGKYKGREFASKQAMLDQLERDSRPPPPPSTEERLRELKRLYDEGLITEEQYKQKQDEILKDL